MEDHKADGTDKTLENAIDQEETIVVTDQSTSYVNFSDYSDIYINEKPNETTTKATLK